MTTTHVAAATVTADRERAAKAMAACLSNKILVGGKPVDAIARRTFPVESPATAEVIGHASRCGVEDVEWAVTTDARGLTAKKRKDHRDAGISHWHW
jgi:hypothetical protein